MTKSNSGMGHRLQRARRARGWSQADLAEKAGVSQSMISHAESGKRRLSVEALTKVAETLGVPVATLQGSSGAPVALRETSAAWQHAKEVRRALASVLERYETLQEFISRYRGLIRPVLPAEVQSQLDGLCDRTRTQQDARSSAMMPVDEHPEFGATLGVPLPPPSQLRKLAELIAAVSQLDDRDLAVVDQVVSRLASLQENGR